MSSSDLITIQVKSPSFVGKVFTSNRSNVANTCDLLVKIPISSKVCDLKKEIQNQLEGRPALGSQKIIYAGRLLDDGAQVSSVFKFDDPKLPPTVHVVLDPSVATRFLDTESTIDSNSKVPKVSSALQAPNKIVLIDGLPYALYPYSPETTSVAHEQAILDRADIPPLPAAEGGNNNRTALLWFGARLLLLVYIFSANASIERMVFMHAVALLFFIWKANIFGVHQVFTRLYHEHRTRQRPPTMDQPIDPSTQQPVQRPVNLFYAFFRSLIPS